MAASLRAGIGILSLLVSGCASLQVSSYAARDLDLTGYRTYTWVVSDRLATGDPRLDNNPFFRDRLRAGVERRLAERGFEKQTGGITDLIVHYHASVRQQVDLDGLEVEHATCQAEDCRPFVYDAGSIVIDLLDARTNALVWRGWAKGSLDGMIDDQDLLEERIDEAVARIFARLPRSPVRARG